MEPSHWGCLQRQIGILQSWRVLKYFVFQSDINSCSVLGWAVLHINRQGGHIPVHRTARNVHNEHNSFCWGHSLFHPCLKVLRRWRGLYFLAVHDSDYNNLSVRSHHVLILRVRSSSWTRVRATSYQCTKKAIILSTVIGLYQYICTRLKSVCNSVHDRALRVNQLSRFTISRVFLFLFLWNSSYMRYTYILSRGNIE